MKHFAILVLAAAAAACTRAESATPSDSGAVAQASQAQGGPDSAAAEALLARADKSRIQGDSNAKYWIVEISDFQCPYCKMWHDSTYATIKREFIATGIARMAYVNYPIQSHVNAVPAARAAMCAGAQDKFWAMHDALFDTQKDWAELKDPMPKFETFAQRIGVKLPEYRACTMGSVIQRLIGADRTRGITAGVNSTPYFFVGNAEVGNEAIRGAAPAQAFRDAMKRARDKAAKKP
jgi:protein-disulfide isomerase